MILYAIALKQMWFTIIKSKKVFNRKIRSKIKKSSSGQAFTRSAHLAEMNSVIFLLFSRYFGALLLLFGLGVFFLSSMLCVPTLSSSFSSRSLWVPLKLLLTKNTPSSSFCNLDFATHRGRSPATFNFLHRFSHCICTSTPIFTFLSSLHNHLRFKNAVQYGMQTILSTTIKVQVHSRSTSKL